jgi:pterin-4a-carbinolamine dehydratase
MKTSIKEIFRDNGHLLEDGDGLACLQRPLRGLLSEARGLPKTLPINAPKPTWEQQQGPNRLVRTFTFGNIESLKFFMSQLFDFQEEMNHHGDITITGYTVMIEAYSHDLGEVTDRDIKYAKEVDLIYRDAQTVRGLNV